MKNNNLVALDTITEKSALAGFKKAVTDSNNSAFRQAVYARYLRGLDAKTYTFRYLADEYNADAGNLNKGVAALEILEKYGLFDDVNAGTLLIKDKNGKDKVFTFSAEKIALADTIAQREKDDKKRKDVFKNALSLSRDALRELASDDDGKVDKDGNVTFTLTRAGKSMKLRCSKSDYENFINKCVVVKGK